MTDKKTTPDDKPKARSSFDRFDRIGALRGATRSLPAFKPEELILPCDPAHPAHATHDPWRYARENPDLQREMREIEAREGKLLQNPTGSTLRGRDEGLVFIKDGARRCAALRYLNEDHRAQQEAEYPVNVEVTFNESIEAFLRAHDITNLRRVDDDPVTKARKIKQRLEGDDAQGIEPLAMEQVCETFGVDEKYVRRILNERTGLVALSPAWQEAIAQGRVAEAIALKAAVLTKDEEEDARHAVQDDLLGKVEAAEKKITPSMLKALARGEDAPPQKPKQERITNKDRGALGKILGALTPTWCRDVAGLSDEEIAELRAKLPAPAQQEIGAAVEPVGLNGSGAHPEEAGAEA